MVVWCNPFSPASVCPLEFRVMRATIICAICKSSCTLNTLNSHIHTPYTHTLGKGYAFTLESKDNAVGRDIMPPMASGSALCHGSAWDSITWIPSKALQDFCVTKESYKLYINKSCLTDTDRMDHAVHLRCSQK